MEYKIVNGRIPEIETSINRLMENGWIPIGGIAVSHTGLFQAMTRTCKPTKTSMFSGLQPKKVIDTWNEIIRGTLLPRKLKITSGLEQSIRTRINEVDGFPEIEDWISYFTSITKSKFLTGQTDSGNWKASLEWAVKPKSIAGVIEGKYHGE